MVICRWGSEENRFRIEYEQDCERKTVELPTIEIPIAQFRANKAEWYRFSGKIDLLTGAVSYSSAGSFACEQPFYLYLPPGHLLILINS